MANDSTFKVKDVNYSCRRMDVFDQMVVAKRLMPVLKGVITSDVLRAVMDHVATAKPENGDVATAKPEDGDPKLQAGTFESSGASAMIPALANALYNLSDDDLKIIVRKCLSLVYRQGVGGAYSPLLAPNGGLLFQDLDLPETLQICGQVIGIHLGSFFSTAR